MSVEVYHPSLLSPIIQELQFVRKNTTALFTENVKSQLCIFVFLPAQLIKMSAMRALVKFDYSICHIHLQGNTLSKDVTNGSKFVNNIKKGINNSGGKHKEK